MPTTCQSHRVTQLWLPCAVAFFAILVFSVSSQILPAALVRTAGDLEVNPEFLALVTVFQYLGFFAAAVTGAVLSDRIGKKPVLQTAAGLMLTGASVWAVAHHVGWLFAGSMLIGMGGGIIEGVSTALLAELFPGRRKLVLNLSQVIFSLGAVGTPALLGLLLPNGVSWRLAFCGLGGLALILLAALSIARIRAVPAADRIDFRTLHSLLRRWSFISPCLQLLLYVMAESCIVIYVNLYLRKYLDAPEAWAIYSLALFWLAISAGRLLCSLIPERFSYEKIIITLYVASGISVVSQGWIDSWSTSVALFTLTGLAMAGTWPMIVGMTAARTQHFTTTAVGVTAAMGSLGCILAAPFMNTLFAIVPHPGTAMALAAAPLGIAVLLTMIDLLLASTRFRSQ
jgi:MFS family permease